jgi:hypothetical protein
LSPKAPLISQFFFPGINAMFSQKAYFEIAYSRRKQQENPHT